MKATADSPSSAAEKIFLKIIKIQNNSNSCPLYFYPYTAHLTCLRDVSLPYPLNTGQTGHPDCIDDGEFCE